MILLLSVSTWKTQILKIYVVRSKNLRLGVILTYDEL
jgi:hypothetical protein